MKRKLSYLSPLPLLAVTGCSPSISETSPQLQTSHKWKKDTAFLDNTVSGIPISQSEEGARRIFHWWEIYNDEILSNLEEEALQNSPTLQAAIHRFEEALYTVGIYESDLYPSLSLSSQATRRRVAKDLRAPSLKTVPATPPTTNPTAPSVQIAPGPKHNNDLSLSFIVQYEVDLWGRLKLTKDQYKSLAEASLEDVSTIQLLLTYQVAQLYYTIRYYEEDLAYIEKIHDCIDNLSSLAEAQYLAGITDATSFLELKSELKSIEAQRAEITRLKEQSEAALAVLIGKEPNEFTLDPLPTNQEWNQTTPPLQIPSEVIANRPDIRRSLKELEAVHAGIGIAKTAYLPSLSLSALAGNESKKANSLFKWKNRIWSTNASIGMLLLDAGARENEVKAVQASFHAKASEYIDSCLVAIGEVEKALSNCYAYQSSIASYREQTLQNQTLTEIEEEKFNSGVIAYQKVLQSKIDSYVSSRSLLDAHYNFQVASLDLIKSIGGSWLDGAEFDTLEIE